MCSRSSPASPGAAVVAVVLLVFAPLIAFGVRWRWRRAEARREEVRRLMRLAAAEDARAEVEAELEYASVQATPELAPSPATAPAPAPAPALSPVTSPERRDNGGAEGAGPMMCAVCFSPTKTRCSRCKAVRYCSGRCQIIHWRQGHKDDCHPPQIYDHSDGARAVANCAGDVENLNGVSTDPSDLCDNSLDIEGRPRTKLDELESEYLKGVSTDPSDLCNNSLDIEGRPQSKLDKLETVQPSSESDLSSEFFSEDVYPGIKPLGSASETDITSDSCTDSSSSASFSSVTDSSSSASFSTVTDSSSSASFSSVTNSSSSASFSSITDSSLVTDSSSSARSSLVSGSSETSHGVSSCENPGVLQESNLEKPCLNVVFPDISRKGDDSTMNLTEVRPLSVTTGLPVHDVFCINNNKQKASVYKSEDIGCRSSNQFGSNTIPKNCMSSSSFGSIVISESCGNAKPSQSTGKCQKAVLGSSGVSSTGVVNITDVQFSKKDGLIGSNARSPLQISSNVPCPGSAPQQTYANIHASYGGSSTEGSTQLGFKRSTTSGFDGSGSVVTERSNDLLLQKPKNLSHQLSFSCGDQTSSNHRSHCLSRDTLSSMDNAPAIRTKISEGTGSITNGICELKTSVRRVVQQFKSAPVLRHYPSALRNDISENCKMLFPYDVFIKLYNCDKLELRPCGLVNCGNSCYANAVLQCLAFTRPLAAYLLQGLHSKACSKQEWCFTCEFESLLMKSKGGQTPLSPIGILSHIHTIGSHLGYGREEDAHEFLRCAIDAMQSVCLKEAGSKAVGPLAEGTTFIQLIFGGYLLSKIKCMRCRGKSERRERMMDLTVEIHGEIGTLEEALSRFTATEILDGENKYHCDRCKSYERAKKKLTVLEAPNVLTIALKRFQSGKFGKLNKAVRFPEYLDLAPYMSGTDDKSPVYRLYAVVVHLDIMNAAFSGHYVCYVKGTQKKWYKMDDSKVKPVEFERVLSKNAYMLLYARCSPRAPSVIRNSILHENVRYKKNKCKEGVQSGHSQEGHTSRTRLSHTISRHGSSECRSQHDSYWSAERQQEPYWSTEHHSISRPSNLLDERRHFPRTDSSSDSSSLWSCSDEGSWSTESTRNSTSTEEFAAYIFRDSDRFSFSSSSALSDDSDGTFNLHSSGQEEGRHTKGLSYENRRLLEGGGSPSFLYSDLTNHSRKRTECRSREAD